MTERQQPAGDGSAEAAAQLDTERGAGIHRAVHALVLRQPSELGAGGNNGVHVALPRALTQCSDGREEEHHLDIAGTRITSHSNQRTGYGSKGIAADVQFVHTVHLGNEGRGKDQCDDQRNVDGPRKHAEQVLVAKDMGGVVGTHTDHGTVNLLQNVGDADHQVVFVGNQQLGSFDKTVLLVFLDFGFIRGIDQLFLRQLLDGENRERVDDQTDNGIDDSHGAPCFGGVAQCGDSQQRDGLDGKAGGECEHEAVGTHLNTLGAVLGDKGGQGRVGDVVGGVEHGIQQSVAD